MKKLAWAVGVVSLVASGWFSALSLNRWEWSRALYFGLLFLAAEVALATALVLRRLATRPPGTVRDDPELRAALRAARPRSDQFEWLEPLSSRSNVFITMLVGGGVLLSALAWLVDKVASRTTTPLREAQLARQLGRIRYPRGGLVVDDVTVLAQAVPHCDDPQLRRLLRRSGHGS